MLNNKRRLLIQFILLSISSILLLMDPRPSGSYIFLIISSIVLCTSPISLLPLILITSVSTSITVIPNFSGYFYYLYLFTLSCFIQQRCRINKSGLIVSLWLVVFTFWLLFVSINSVTGDISHSVKFILAVLPFPIFSLFSYDGRKVSQYMLISALAASSYIFIKILFAPIYYNPSNVDMMSSDYNLQVTIAANINPNTVSQTLLLFYLIILTCLSNLKNKFSYIMVLLPIIPILIIGSRTVFVALLLISTILFYLYFNISKKIKFLLTIFAFLFSSILYQFFYSTNERLNLNSIIEDGGSGRFYNWYIYYNNIIPNYFYRGIGFGRNNYDSLGYYFDADNMYVDLLCQTGIIGLILFILLLIVTFNKVLRSENINKTLALSFLLFIVIIGLGETVFDPIIFLFIFLFLIIVIVSNNKEKIKL